MPSLPPVFELRRGGRLRRPRRRGGLRIVGCGGRSRRRRRVVAAAAAAGVLDGLLEPLSEPGDLILEPVDRVAGLLGLLLCLGRLGLLVVEVRLEPDRPDREPRGDEQQDRARGDPAPGPVTLRGRIGGGSCVAHERDLARIARPSEAIAGSPIRYCCRRSKRYFASPAMARSGRRTWTPSPGGGAAARGGPKPCSASQRGRYWPATLPSGHHSGGLLASPGARRRRLWPPISSRPSTTASPGSGGSSTPASRAIPATATRAWWVASAPNFSGASTPSPAAHVRSAPATRPSSPISTKPSSSAARPATAGPSRRGTATTRWTSRRSPLGSSTSPPSAGRATAPVITRTPARSSSWATALPASGPNKDSGDRSGVTIVICRSR